MRHIKVFRARISNLKKYISFIVFQNNKKDIPKKRLFPYYNWISSILNEEVN